MDKLNLAKKKDREAFDTWYQEVADDMYSDMLDLFLSKGESKLYLANTPIVSYSCENDEERVCLIRNGIPSIEFEMHEVVNVEKIEFQDSDVPSFVVVPYNKKQKYIAILNGDDEYSDYAPDQSLPVVGPNHLTMSFECLRRFYDDASKNVVRRLVNQEIELVAHLPDGHIEFTATEKKKLSEWNNNSNHGPHPLKPPKAGYSIVSNRWHRSATVLLYDKKNKFSILIGQDEGTYFGVELVDNPKTIDAAYTSLMPKEVRNKASVVRQGEWFAMPVSIGELPASDEIALSISEPTEECVYLPREDDESAKHFIEDAEEIIVDKNGVIYALNPTLRHERGEHQNLDCHGWVTFVKNTAVRSYSVEGVD